MKNIRKFKLIYGVGFGRYTDDIELSDGESEEEIEQIITDIAMEKFDWTYIEVEDEQ